MVIDTGKQTDASYPMSIAAVARGTGPDTGVMPKTSRPVVWLFYAYIISSPFFGFSFVNTAERGLARVDWLAAGALLGVFFLGFVANRYPLRRSPANMYVLLFAFTGLLSIVNLFNADSSIVQFIQFGTKAAQLILAIAFFFVVSAIPLSENELKLSLRLWILVALVVSLYAIYQVFARVYGWPLAYIELTNPSVTVGGGEARIINGFAQASSFFREPSYLGAYLLGPIVLVCVPLLRGGSHVFLSKFSLANWMLLATLFLALLLTSSQGAYFSLLVTLCAMYATRQINRLRTTRLFLIFLAVLIFCGMLLALFDIGFLEAIALRFKYLILNIMHPLETVELSSYRVRSECMRAALEVGLSHPLLGVGLNNMSFYPSVCQYSLGWSQLVADQGLLSTAALLLVFWVLLQGLNKLSKEARLTSFWSVTSLCLVFVLVSDLVNGIFTYNWVDLQRWFTLALANLVYIQASSRLPEVTGKSLENGRLLTGQM
jgi:hypothetical protein